MSSRFDPWCPDPISVRQLSMRRYKTLLLQVLVLSFYCSSLLYAAGQWKILRTNFYLTAQEQRAIVFTPPPADGSKEDLADLAVVREWEKKRTAAQCEKANAEAGADFESFFGEISPFRKPLPSRAASALKRIKMETDGIAADIKERYNRPRPFLRDAGLEPCLGKIGGLSYPSGHATISRMYALVLSELVPARRAEYLARADEIALLRVIGGAHSPADIEAGKRLAETLFPAYLESPAFRKEMEMLRGCLVLPKLRKTLNSTGH